MKDKSISIVLPVYNEEESIGRVIEDIKKIMDATHSSYEIIAVNDCSTDSTGQILDSLKKVLVLHHAVNKGYGSSLKTGILKATNDYILILDADGTYPAEEIPRLLEYINTYDMVVGARTGEQVAIPLLRRPAKWFLGKIANYISGTKIPDVNSGLRVFKKSLALEYWKILPERFSFTITITLASLTNGYQVKYIPINYYKRAGTSTIRPIKDFIEFNKLLLRMCLFFRPLKIFVPMSMLIFLTGLAIFLTGLLITDKLYDITFVMASLSAIQIFMLGLLAELIIRHRI